MTDERRHRTKDRPPNHSTWIVVNKSSRNGSPIEGISVHSTESQDVPHTSDDLLGIRHHFDIPAVEASAHVGVDGDANSERWVPTSMKAWTMGHSEINARTFNIEFVGRAAQPASAWEERQIKCGAKWAAYVILNAKACVIDPRHVRRGDIKMRNGEPVILPNGILRHKDLTDAGIGTHVDPGPTFPMHDFCDAVRYYVRHGWTLAP